MKKKHTPVSLEEAFGILDKEFSKEEKQLILQGEDMHFSLGLWIRNEWIHGADLDSLELLARDVQRGMAEAQGEAEPSEMLQSFFMMNPDCLSSDLLDLYAKHLEMLGPERL